MGPVLFQKQAGDPNHSHIEGDMKTKLIFLVTLAALVVVGLYLNKMAGPPEESEEPPKAEAPKPAPRADFQPGRVVTVTTNRGAFKFALYEKDMPITTRNFVTLATSGFYKGLKFHRVEPLVIQGGDPKGDGTGGSKNAIKLETKPGLGFDVPYMVGMARTNDPNSATSQFFVNKQPYPGWDGQYASFGRVFEGQKVVDSIRKGDVMKSVTVSKPTPAEAALIKKSVAALAGPPGGPMMPPGPPMPPPPPAPPAPASH